MPSGKLGKKVFPIATAICRDKGYASFKDGSQGAVCRGQVAEKLAHKMTKGKKK